MAEPSHEPHQELKGEIPHDDAADPENVGKAGESDPAQSAQVDAENGGKADIDGSQDAVEGEQAAVVHEELMNFALAEAGSPYALDDELEEAAESNEDEERANSIELIERISKQLSEKPVPVRVHDITIIGNTKTKDSVIEAQLEELRRVKTMQELIQKASYAKTHLQELGIFDKCLITLDAGPEELPQTANVVVEVEEAQRPFSGDIGFYSKPETRKWSLEGALKWKNLLGYGETWDGTGCYGLDTTSEVGVGLNYPRFRGWLAALQVRASHLTQDWSKCSSYKERLLGFSVGLVSDECHDVSYNLTWRDLRDPSRVGSQAVRQQLGHSLLSSVKYAFKLDRRNSALRPTKGFAFASTTQVAGLGFDSRLLRFVRQELEFRWSVPLGFLNSALNFGVASGVIFPWGPGFMQKTTPISDRFFMGGHSSLLGELRGPSALLGFRRRGVGPSDLRRQPGNETHGSDETKSSLKRDTLGGDLAASAFADFSFDLPLRFCRDYGIHGHSFVCGGNLVALTGENREPFSFRRFFSDFRCCTGAGLVIPTKLFRLEVNYCHLLRAKEFDRVRRGFQLSVNSPY